mmetsp:Transcript_81929/g.182087  ORF Transcript_81929/g.182087 Transcript_81929/m.182087 type:complete len:255 (-) Transcript_81929:262-1026(-)
MSSMLRRSSSSSSCKAQEASNIVCASKVRTEGGAASRGAQGGAGPAKPGTGPPMPSSSESSVMGTMLPAWARSSSSKRRMISSKSASNCGSRGGAPPGASVAAAAEPASLAPGSSPQALAQLSTTASSATGSVPATAGARCKGASARAKSASSICASSSTLCGTAGSLNLSSGDGGPSLARFPGPALTAAPGFPASLLPWPRVTRGSSTVCNAFPLSGVALLLSVISLSPAPLDDPAWLRPSAPPRPSERKPQQ